MEPYIRGLIQAVLLFVAGALGWVGLVLVFVADGRTWWGIGIGVALVAVAVKMIRVSGVFRRD